jgi:N-acetylmuramoyl-L-alanine amidase CwlA
MTKITRITVHHTAMVTGARSRSEVARTLRSIQRNHFGRGWADIGYHFVVDASGRTWQCRPIKYQGAHAGNHQLNRGNIGITVLGNYDEQALSALQKESLVTLLATLCREYGLTTRQIATHLELKNTACPGRNLQTFINRLRAGTLP